MTTPGIDRGHAVTGVSEGTSTGGASTTVTQPPVPTEASRPARRARTWPVPLALIALSLIPLGAGSARLVDLSTGSELMPADAHHPAVPVALIVHIVTSTIYSLLGAFQFSAGFRRRHPRWHRTAGRVLIPTGVGVAASALWLTIVYPSAVDAGPVLYWSRLVVALAMLTCLALAVRAIRIRHVAVHRAWMIRGYALGLGAGTQVVTLGLGQAAFGTATVTTDVLTAAGWAVNLAVAETIVRRPWGARRPRRTSTQATP